MLDATMAAATYDAIRAILVDAQVSVRIGGAKVLPANDKVVVAMRDVASTEGRATLFGTSPGYKGDLYIKVAELTALSVTISDGEPIEIKEGSTYQTYRARTTDTIGTQVIRVSYFDRFAGE